MIAVVVASSRLICSAAWWQIAAFLLTASFAAPFAVYAVRATKEDVRKAAILGLAIILVVTVLVTTASAVPFRDPCVTCREIWPEWFCVLRGCW